MYDKNKNKYYSNAMYGYLLNGYSKSFKWWELLVATPIFGCGVYALFAYSKTVLALVLVPVILVAIVFVVAAGARGGRGGSGGWRRGGGGREGGPLYI